MGVSQGTRQERPFRLFPALVKCAGPAFCPFADEKRFTKVLVLVMVLLVLMTAVALAAIIKGKDGIITGSVCTAMSAIVTTILVGGIHRHAQASKSSLPGNEGGDTNANRPDSKDQ